MKKHFNKLKPSDFEKFPVWEFLKNGCDLTPLKKSPYNNRENRVFGTNVTLSCGITIKTMILNFDVCNTAYNKHMISIYFEVNNKWIELHRYFDAEYEENDALELSKKMNMDIDDIFPIKYDLSTLVEGNHDFNGTIQKKIEHQLSLDELMEYTIKNQL
ncbi:hypothetical protein LNTAR_06354 [Lentisphaera araneosa HTCC2155]|uniref:Uncharacterized protein n=1 Tax=Lentisphaera araneosa HTCC2155 TaxID=313628 RepID=A6DN97_9BACT|nr:hypothetical protein [Lentisphaera araneosa]EDM26845.1 hypothetical protein LNTAR_06354 [Lentisphaera araneosa HTCC2155]